MLPYRRLGRTGLDVSSLSVGTVKLGMDYGIAVVGEPRRTGQYEATRLLHLALDLGVNLIDTARRYGDSESLIGQFLGSRRHEYVLASKVSSFHHESLSASALRERVRSSVHESLRHLRTDVIDVMLIHCAASEKAVRGDVLEVLEGLKQEGCLRFLGASVYGEAAVLSAIESGYCDCIQIAYNLLDRRAEARILEAARERDVGVVVRSVLLKGALTHRYRHLPDKLQDLKQAAARVERIAKDHGLALPELAYRYVLSAPLPLTALVGAASVAEVEQAVHFAEAGALSEELLGRIGSLRMADEILLDPHNWPNMPALPPRKTAPAGHADHRKRRE